MVLVSILLVVLVAAAVYVGIRNKKEAKSQAASNALFHAQKSYETEMKAFAATVAPAPAPTKGAAAPQTPSPESVQFKKTDVDAKFSQSLKDYKTVAEQYPGTRAAYEALLAIGSLYQNHGEPAKAVPFLQQASEQAPGATDKAQAFSSLGYALEGSGKYTDAVQAFQKALGVGDAAQVQMKGDLLLSVARNEELAGDKAKARETYDQIIKQLPDSEQAHQAEYLKARL
jgi:tetratricopeptide (TPR) repeat protein